MKLVNTILAAAIVAMASCTSNSSTNSAAQFEPIPFNQPTDLALAVVDDNAAYNYFSCDQWGSLDANIKATYTPVGVCLLTDSDSIIVALHDVDNSSKMSLLSGLAPVNQIPVYKNAEAAEADMDGAANCSLMTSEDCDPTALKAIRRVELVNVDGNLWYIPALGQLKLIGDSKSKLNDALKAFGGDHIRSSKYWSSTQGTAQNTGSSQVATFWMFGFQKNFTIQATPTTDANVRAVMDVQL